MAGTAGLGNDALELVNLLLGTTESSELSRKVSIRFVTKEHEEAQVSYPLLGELAGTLVLGVAEQLDHALLIGGKTVRETLVSNDSLIIWHYPELVYPNWANRNLPSNLLDNVTDESGALAQVALGARDAGLDNARGSLLYFQKKSQISLLFIVHRLHETASRDPPGGETGLFFAPSGTGGGFNVRGPC